MCQRVDGMQAYLLKYMMRSPNARARLFAEHVHWASGPSHTLRDSPLNKVGRRPYYAYSLGK